MGPVSDDGRGADTDDRGAGHAGHVFGYASLINDMHRHGEELHTLRGFRRAWNVATDNSLTIGRYKIYLDPQTGEQPPVFVAFANLVPDESCAVAGVLFPVSAAALEALDLRERNYRRRDVRAHLDEEVDGPVWCYFGTEQAEARYREGAAAGRAVISREYLERVRSGFARAGREALAAFEASTDPPGCPVVELERVDVE